MNQRALVNPAVGLVLNQNRGELFYVFFGTKLSSNLGLGEIKPLLDMGRDMPWLSKARFEA